MEHLKIKVEIPRVNLPIYLPANTSEFSLGTMWYPENMTSGRDL